jgi:hypothetical protein
MTVHDRTCSALKVRFPQAKTKGFGKALRALDPDGDHPITAHVNVPPSPYI